MIVCRQCQAQLPDDLRFCFNCGMAVVSSAGQPTARIGVPPAAPPRSRPLPIDDAEMIVRRYEAMLPQEGLATLERIDPDKLANARKTYAHYTDDERPLLLHDITFFGSGRDGMLITDRRIYARDNIFDRARSYAFGWLEKVECVNQEDTLELWVNGQRFYTPALYEAEDIEMLCDLLRELDQLERDAWASGQADPFQTELHAALDLLYRAQILDASEYESKRRLIDER